MTLISPEVGKQIQQALSAMDVPVKLVLFTQEEVNSEECQYCSETRQMVEEIAQLLDKVSVEVYDFGQSGELASQYGVDKIPAIAVVRNTDPEVDYGIRLYGIPAGYEFSAFIEDILMVSQERHNLSEKTLRELERIDRPVHIQVYTTPT